jgi:uncharacterized Ntn-hydrolase superfamily protein
MTTDTWAGNRAMKMSLAVLIMVLVMPMPANAGAQSAPRTFDLRVDDSPEPLKELRRLVTLQRAYNHNERGRPCARA